MASANSLLQSSVAELLERYPSTAAVFMRHRMACVGCAFAAFETIADAGAIYRLDRTSFVNELTQVIRTDAADKSAASREKSK